MPLNLLLFEVNRENRPTHIYREGVRRLTALYAGVFVGFQDRNRPTAPCQSPLLIVLPEMRISDSKFGQRGHVYVARIPPTKPDRESVIGQRPKLENTEFWK